MMVLQLIVFLAIVTVILVLSMRLTVKNVEGTEEQELTQ